PDTAPGTTPRASDARLPAREREGLAVDAPAHQHQQQARRRVLEGSGREVALVVGHVCNVPGKGQARCKRAPQEAVERAMHESLRRRRLPHWDVPGAAYFITPRLAGSIPAQGLLDIEQYRAELERRPRPTDLSESEWRYQIDKRTFARRNSWL